MWCDCVLLFTEIDILYFTLHVQMIWVFISEIIDICYVCDYLNDQASEEKSIFYLLIWLTEK